MDSTTATVQVASPFQEALDVIEQLSPADQLAVLEIIEHRLIEARRAEMAANARATLAALGEGRARYGSVDDLRRDLSDEP
jgi:hypothetical protein